VLVELWPIGRAKDYPQNPRKWSARAIEKVAASIREYGWRQPVVVDTNDVIVIGHLRRAAGKFLGLTEVPVHVARDLTPAQIRGLRLADNRKPRSIMGRRSTGLRAARDPGFGFRPESQWL
jgi:ParB-like chromosome segregation protein Spo0J